MRDAEKWFGLTETIDDRVRRHAASRPDAVAFVGLDRAITWAELDAAADRAAADLAARGVGPGSRVGWLGRNDIAFPVLLLAAWRRRAAVAGLNWRLSADELRRSVELVDPVLVVSDDTNVALARDAVADASLLVLGPQDSLPWAGAPAGGGTTLAPEPDDIALLWFTSGSTGTPKAVAVGRARNEYSLSVPTPFQTDTESQVLVIPPVFHVAGSMWVQYGMRNGGTVVFSADASPDGIVRALAEHAITHALMVPTLIRALLDVVDGDVASGLALEHVGYGTAPIPRPLLRSAVEVLGCRFTQVYGLTEAGGVVAYLPPEDHVLDGPNPGRLDSAGRPPAGAEVEVRDPVTDAVCAPGEVGILHLRTPSVMLGYWSRSGGIDAPVGVDEWLATGDLARKDADGYLYVVGRADDMIISGGENVQPAEVEAVLDTMPGVVESAVYGTPDDRWGQVVSAAVVTSEPLDADAIVDFCRSRLAHYKCPSVVRTVTELPRNATGKVLRGRLRTEPAHSD